MKHISKKAVIDIGEQEPCLYGREGFQAVLFDF